MVCRLSLLSDVFSRKIITTQFKGITKIRGEAFYNCTLLKEIDLPNSIETIGDYAFYGCTSLKEIKFPNSIVSISNNAFQNCTSLRTIYTEDMNPYIKIDQYAFIDIKDNLDIVASQPDNSMICIAQNRVLFHNKIVDPAAEFVIPETVINLTGGSCCKYGSISLTSVVIPDTVEMVGDDVFYDHSSLAKITVGSSVRYMSTDLCPGKQTTTLVFRQPAGMYVELPKAGDGSGLAYDKSSHSITIYTDNECIKNYDWSADNVTATFYPLSQAPV